MSQKPDYPEPIVQRSEAKSRPSKAISRSLDLIVPPASPLFPPLADGSGFSTPHVEHVSNAMMTRGNYEVVLHSPCDSPGALTPLRDVSDGDGSFDRIHTSELSNPPRTSYEVVLHDPQSRKVILSFISWPVRVFPLFPAVLLTSPAGGPLGPRAAAGHRPHRSVHGAEAPRLSLLPAVRRAASAPTNSHHLQPSRPIHKSAAPPPPHPPPPLW